MSHRLTHNVAWGDPAPYQFKRLAANAGPEIHQRACAIVDRWADGALDGAAAFAQLDDLLKARGPSGKYSRQKLRSLCEAPNPAALWPEPDRETREQWRVELDLLPEDAE
jgi:hypothetical protein